mgnify:CR=1 FL=1
MFQSTRLREARHLDFNIVLLLLMFQSTRLREARREFWSFLKAMLSFNPRAYVRRDL